ncbi:carbamoyltransferase C-terminal domain-containing protein [Chitinibacter sp. ZOR0017]|uniref:carbamoyltransferase family protein n=1 Tax=Chitinibacter sp. ZOR0017 TaxID=1339254 RepID=UPI000645B508|nr:carbamoyltransferase C-terminal domain-containing protein [Chitinibacter sp. ZOR0017]
MIILGISGLPNAQEMLLTKNPEIDSLDERICQGLDSAACLVIDGVVIAAASEERFTGEKGTGKFPSNAIAFCLEVAGINKKDVDYIAHGFNYNKYKRFFSSNDDYFESVLSTKSILSELNMNGWQDLERRFISIDHHLAHAASAYYPSGYKDALCIVSDGMAEISSLTIYECINGDFKEIHKNSISNSLGLVYSICTRFLGFTFNSDEYKVMGMAAYGRPITYHSFFKKLINLTNGDISVTWPKNALQQPEKGYPEIIKFIEEQTGLCARKTKEEITQEHYDFAAALQSRLTSILEELTQYWIKKTGISHLCLSGGTFLNCRANESICNSPLVDAVFIQPASGDDGTALGAAFCAAHASDGQEKIASGFDPYLGPSYQPSCIQSVLNELEVDSNLKWTYVGIGNDYFEKAAADIADDKIIAWFHGGMEFGPRALGNRSILAKPNGENIKSRINCAVKFREAFRPFAPAVLDDDLPILFTTRGLSPTQYMLCTAKATEIGIKVASGVIHEDGSARIQTVNKDINELFYKLLLEVRKKTGYGCTVNTSFNIKGQPLIMDPKTAIETFAKIGLDKLYIEGYILWKI